MSKFNFRKFVLMLADIFIITVSGITLNYVLSLLPSYPPEASRGLLYFIVFCHSIFSLL